jgi:hypothetical protein
MDAKEYEHACERGLNKMRQRSKLSRAQTFAFGQHATQTHDSPSRNAISAGSVNTSFEMDFSYNRLHARRMASY